MKKVSFNIFALSASATIALASAALADGTTTTATVPQTSTAAAPAVTAEPAWYQKLKVTSLTYFDGPPVGALDSHFQTAHGLAREDIATGAAPGYLDPSSPVGFREYFSVAMPFGESSKIEPVIPFKIKAYPESANALGDIYFKLANSKYATFGGANLYSDLRVYLPTSDGSKAKGLNLALGTKQNLTYAVPDTKWTLGTIGVAKFSFYEVAGPRIDGKVKKDIELTLVPNVSYQALANLSIDVGYELDGNHMSGQSLFEYNSDGTYLEPGITWDISSSLSFNPYVDIFTGDRIATDTMLVGAAVTWKLM